MAAEAEYERDPSHHAIAVGDEVRRTDTVGGGLEFCQRSYRALEPVQRCHF